MNKVSQAGLQWFNHNGLLRDSNWDQKKWVVRYYAERFTINRDRDP